MVAPRSTHTHPPVVGNHAVIMAAPVLFSTDPQRACPKPQRFTRQQGYYPSGEALLISRQKCGNPPGSHAMSLSFGVFSNLIKPARPAVLSWAALTGESAVAKLSASALCWLHQEQMNVLLRAGFSQCFTLSVTGIVLEVGIPQKHTKSILFSNFQCFNRLC